MERGGCEVGGMNVGRWPGRGTWLGSEGTQGRALWPGGQLQEGRAGDTASVSSGPVLLEITCVPPQFSLELFPHEKAHFPALFSQS